MLNYDMHFSLSYKGILLHAIYVTKQHCSKELVHLMVLSWHFESFVGIQIRVILVRIRRHTLIEQSKWGDDTVSIVLSYLLCVIIYTENYCS